MKKLTLSILMLVAMFMIVGGVGSVSAYSCAGSSSLTTVCDDDCQVIIDEPVAGGYYDPVTIAWHYVGNCRPVEAYLAYQEGTCDGNNWNRIARDLNPNITSYEWDVSDFDSGLYCIAVNVDQLSGPDAGNTSGVFTLDLTAPEVSIEEVSTPKFGECQDGEGTCYVNQSTQVSLTCEDQGQYQSGEPYIIKYKINNGNEEIYDGSFNFGADSNHELEYWCYDEVLKESDHKFKDFIVESVAPEITRTVGYPKVPAGEGGYYVTQDTEICIDATDPIPHPVGGEVVSCMVNGNPIQLEDGCFYYAQDSQHTLTCTATDALGNTGSETWNDIVESQAPVISVVVGDPKFPSQIPGYEWYVSTDTEVCVSAYDPEPHPVGDVEVNCQVNQEPVQLDDEGCFSFDEESYHTLRCVANDALGNEANLTKGFIVDNTAPETIKEVGRPNHECGDTERNCLSQYDWDGFDYWDYIVTMDTEITLSCEEQGPHPSGISGLWYRILLDGNYDTPHTDWTFVPYDNIRPIQFNEESEHLLEFYCVDNVGKESETDSELFKVEGEEVIIPLYEKWNLISIPFNLLNNNIEEVFSQISDEVEIVWAYDEDGWHVYNPGQPEISDLTTVDPGYGYWVKATEDTELVVGGSLLSPGPGVPPSRDLQQGWNLIGRYGLDEDQTAYCALFSLVDTTIGHPRWSALYSYDAEVHDVFVPLGLDSYTNPGEGYWVEMDVEDTYSPATACWGFPR